MTDFVDTNILVYCYDDADPTKQEAAGAVVRNGRFHLSAQVLSEFYVAVTRKLQRPLAPEIARSAVHDLAAVGVIPLDRAVVLGALVIEERHHLSYWDSLIVSAAVAGGCDRLLTEDLSHGRVIEGVLVHNPLL